MSTSTYFNPSYQKMLSRDVMLLMLESGLASKSNRFVRQAALSWLAIYPGDIEINHILAKALYSDGKVGQATSILDEICQVDPEYVEAQSTLADILTKSGGETQQALIAIGNVYSLTGKLIGSSIPEWAKNIWEARKATNEVRFGDAETLILKVLGSNEQLILASILHCDLIKKSSTGIEYLNLVKLYHDRWPNCIHFSLALAEGLMNVGDETGAVSLLHECVANDSNGQVPQRMWGKDFQFRPLWPEKLEINFELSIPTEIANQMGKNQLGEGKITETPKVSVYMKKDETVNAPIMGPDSHPSEVVPSASAGDAFTPDKNPQTRPESSPAATAHPELKRPQINRAEALRAVEEEFEKIAKHLKKPEVVRKEGRFPIYVVLTSNEGLTKQYGAQTTQVIRKELDNLAEQIQHRSGWGSMVFVPDEDELMKRLGLAVTPAIDPWKIKLSIVDLDKALAKKGEMIGAMLIVGGPQVVPFHNLPNPTDDLDHEVASDNPYTTLDSNYFVPEWMTGRLPGEAGGDAGLLLAQIRKIAQYHLQNRKTQNFWQRLMTALSWKNILKWIKYGRKGNVHSSFGLTAAVWRRSSLAAYRPVGEGNSLLVSPPETSDSLQPEKMFLSPLGYYNLHGVDDGGDWYGQRESIDANPGPDYPVALSPKDLVKNGEAPKVVFSEACYGAYMENKTESNSMALKFIAMGSNVLVGSTCIAYGSITSPLIGGDLLGYLFWKNLKTGLTAGEAFFQAKVELVREMNKRQGYLDGEDQKTLISFVLYGDPLFASETKNKKAKSPSRMINHLAVKTVSDHYTDDKEIDPISEEMILQAKQVVETYLPGMENGDVHITKQNVIPDIKQNRNSFVGTKHKDAKVEPADRFMVTISKAVPTTLRTHHHYARITMDSKGKMVKLAVSR